MTQRDATNRMNDEATTEYGARRSVRRAAFGIVAAAAAISILTLVLAVPSRAESFTLRQAELAGGQGAAAQAQALR